MIPGEHDQGLGKNDGDHTGHVHFQEAGTEHENWLCSTSTTVLTNGNTTLTQGGVNDAAVTAKKKIKQESQGSVSSQHQSHR